jgi:hypothetical protein
MKQSKNELDVDSIGGQDPLTKEEEIAISEFIRSQKSKNKRYREKRNMPIVGRNKETA